jgi:hypothetical protein
MDNQTWIIETGDSVIRKKAASGIGSLTPWELLVYCLWVVDYCMRNGGDLDNAAIFFLDFRSNGRKSAEVLDLPFTRAAFALPNNDLERVYFEQFDSICAEIKRAR